MDSGHDTDSMSSYEVMSGGNPIFKLVSSSMRAFYLSRYFNDLLVTKHIFQYWKCIKVKYVVVHKSAKLTSCMLEAIINIAIALLSCQS